MKAIRVLLIFVFGITLSGIAQDDIRLLAEGPKVLAVGEVARLSYTLNAKGETFNGPKIDGFLFNGPMLSTSMSTQIINNQVTQSVSYIYNYTIQAVQEGVFTIPAASVTFKGKTYTSEPVKIEVVKGEQARQQSGQGQGTSDPVTQEDLFTRIEVDRRQVYKGEQILATIKIYTRVNLARFGEIKMPSFGGFWNQEIPTSEQVNLERVNLNGRVYNMGVIRKSILVPQKTGPVTIDPFEIECYVNVARRGQRSPFDDFFGPSYETVTRRIKSPPVEITVKPFPADQPAGFTGAVGKFTVTALLDKPEVRTNDPVSLKVTVKGNGNIKLIELPPFRFPADLEIYDPKVTENIDTGNSGITGSKTFEYLIIPRHAGTFEIPAWSFSWFDPEAGRFSTYTSQPFSIRVEKGEGDTEASLVSVPGKEDIRVIGQDIRFIKTGKPKFRPVGGYFFGSAVHLFIIILLLAVSAGFLLYFRRRFRNEADFAGSRFRKANQVSLKRLASASRYLAGNEREKFLEEVARTLWGYVADKFNLSLSGLSRETVREVFAERGIDGEIASRFIEAIDAAEYLRFAPVTDPGDLDRLLEMTGELIVSIEKTYRK